MNIYEMLTSSLEKIQKIVDVNSVIGKPITVGEDVTIIPITKVHIGMGGGGTDFATKNVHLLLSSNHQHTDLLPCSQNCQNNTSSHQSLTIYLKATIQIYPLPTSLCYYSSR